MSLNEYACRIVQGLIGKLGLKDQLQIIDTLKPRLGEITFNQHGNHVLQKIIQSVPCSKLEDVTDILSG